MSYLTKQLASGKPNSISLKKKKNRQRGYFTVLNK